MIRQYHPVTCPTDGISQTAVTLLISNACDDSTLIASSSLLPFLSVDIYLYLPTFPLFFDIPTTHVRRILCVMWIPPFSRQSHDSICRVPVPMIPVLQFDLSCRYSQHSSWHPPILSKFTGRLDSSINPSYRVDLLIQHLPMTLAFT